MRVSWGGGRTTEGGERRAESRGRRAEGGGDASVVSLRQKPPTQIGRV